MVPTAPAIRVIGLKYISLSLSLALKSVIGDILVSPANLFNQNSFAYRTIDNVN